MPYPAGVSPSQRFRFEQYFKLLKDNGFQYELKPFWNEEEWEILYKSGHFSSKIINTIRALIRRCFLLFELSGFDWVFIHREIAPIGPPLLESLIGNFCKGRMIYDFDDAIWLPNTSKENKIIGWLKFHSKTGAICKMAYKVSCGNEYLLDFALKFNLSTHYNPSTIDLDYHKRMYQHSATESKIVIGWTGSHSTLKYLKLVEDVIRQIEGRFDIEFLVIANKMPSLDIKSLSFIEWNLESEIEDLSKIDIGIMPLLDDEWAQGKCGFKLLQYMSLGIPSLASPVGVNKKIISSGSNGFLCATEQEWEESLIKLINDPELRKRIGTSGKVKVEQDYSLKSNENNFLQLFS